jgi:hypothetical protein
MECDKELNLDQGLCAVSLAFTKASIRYHLLVMLKREKEWLMFSR